MFLRTLNIKRSVIHTKQCYTIREGFVLYIELASRWLPFRLFESTIVKDTIKTLVNRANILPLRGLLQLTQCQLASDKKTAR